MASGVRPAPQEPQLGPAPELGPGFVDLESIVPAVSLNGGYSLQHPPWSSDSDSGEDNVDPDFADGPVGARRRYAKSRETVRQFKHSYLRKGTAFLLWEHRRAAKAAERAAEEEARVAARSGCATAFDRCCSRLASHMTGFAGLHELWKAITFKFLVSLLCTMAAIYVCEREGVHQKMPLNSLFSLTACMPLVYSIGQNFARREYALSRLADLKGKLTCLVRAHADWQPRKRRRKGSAANFKQLTARLIQHIRVYLSEYSDVKPAAALNSKREAVEMAGLKADNVRRLTAVRRTFDHMAQANEDFSVLRDHKMSLHLSQAMYDFASLRNVVETHTPKGLTTFLHFSVFVLPVLCAPHFALYNAQHSWRGHSFMGYLVAAVYCITLNMLLSVQSGLANPFDQSNLEGSDRGDDIGLKIWKDDIDLACKNSFGEVAVGIRMVAKEARRVESVRRALLELDPSASQEQLVTMKKKKKEKVSHKSASKRYQVHDWETLSSSPGSTSPETPHSPRLQQRPAAQQRARLMSEIDPEMPMSTQVRMAGSSSELWAHEEELDNPLRVRSEGAQRIGAVSEDDEPTFLNDGSSLVEASPGPPSGGDSQTRWRSSSDFQGGDVIV